MLSQQPVPMQQRISMSLRAAARRVAVQPMAAARSVSVFAAHSAPAGLPRSPLLAARAELFETRCVAAHCRRGGPPAGATGAATLLTCQPPGASARSPR